MSEAGQTSCCDTALNGGLGLNHSYNLDTYICPPQALCRLRSQRASSLCSPMPSLIACSIACLLASITDLLVAHFLHNHSLVP